jgi:HAD superfamily phosphoserine phosphatase-like hydrolase
MTSEAKKRGGIAAFFDLDGTLMPLPSLERRFFRVLRYRREIRTKNYLSWLKEAVRLMPRGINAVVHANKMYLKGVKSLDESDGENRGDSSGHASGHQAGGQAAHSSLVPPGRARRNLRLPVPHFFAAGVERVAWHAKQGHAIVLVSGTLEPLASAAALALVLRLAASGITTSIAVCATRLEKADGIWTGHVLDEAMFGEAKARAVKKLAEEMQLDLPRCFAYGDTANDRWLLAAVGKPAAVNPSRTLARIAQGRSWPVLHWGGEKKLNQKPAFRRKTSAQRPQSREDRQRLRHAERWI